MNIFSVNEELEIQVENFLDSKIITIENFLKYPEYVVEFLNNTQTPLWKINENNSHNGIFFDDRRHIIENNSIAQKIQKFAEGQKNLYEKVYSNYTSFYNNSFNDYKNNYWWPHRDSGHTAIIYLNHYTGSGTNLYDMVEQDNIMCNEHEQPWRPKDRYRILKTLNCGFNKLVMFDAKKFLHGMAIEDETFFNQRRINIAVFFK